MARNKQLNSNECSMQEISAKLNKIIQSLENQDKRIASLENLVQEQVNIGKEIDVLKAANLQLTDTITNIQGELRRIAMNKNRKKVEIAGFPRTENESLGQLVSAVSSAISATVEGTDIKDVFRRRDSPRGPGAVVVKFKTVKLRDSFLKASKGVHLTGAKVGVRDSNCRIYVNAPLTPETKRVLFQMKQAQALKGWYRVWVYGAEVYVRLEEQGSPIRVQTLDEVNTLLQ